MALFAASCDDVETQTKFAQSLDLDYPLLADPEKKAATAYGVLGALGVPSRTTFYIGTDGKILYIEREVRPFSAGKDVVAKLGELNAPKKK